ncbi:4Fe-4S binding protein [Clostridium grantii]|uniref:4Fe-4S binding domain-containing protein n=1 Tax=Clostridium grantii DSM 8605 TaxID=1121316 RepID=A0A1M5Y1F0_9CLOT|nr:4Fe-4S binding protein [Clostridium grantii]SHI05769.1 4Fe-4S binding domain-containing protein [Clostridium grantii DSM 8605]
MNISKTEILELLQDFSDNSIHNSVSGDVALSPQYAGIRIFEWPIVGVSSAQDEIYKTYTNPEIVGENYLNPSEWMDGAKSIISIFNPFTEHIKDSNAGGNYPSDEWMHGRIEGQAYVTAAAQALAELIRSKGGKAMVPIADERFKIYKEPKIYSNWSERHAAYVAGMGTFSLNRAIITKKGIAGRFCSIITDIELTADQREYTGLYDNCIMCKACQRACPVDAINEHGKSHIPCNIFLEQIKAEHPPWYGCGKCQAGMPCESRIPPKNPKADYSTIKNIYDGN